MTIDRDWLDRYHRWFRHAKPLLERAEWTEAFNTYPWPEYLSAPWSPMTKPLTTARVALVSSGGISLEGQRPFDETRVEGDSGFRVIDRDALPMAKWQIRHGHYDPAEASADYNAVLPLDILKQLAEEGAIGSVAPRHVSFLGFQTNAWIVANELAPEMEKIFKEDDVDAVMLVPV
ncbi:glycine/sarcosine/betaine reductase selenoprotein B family protein [Sulfobacillus harzensis]|uniref:Uncharacterized protein n=1 Tax=Sulfobacillus harzensis TaxID=2729629 RepID=A0A7Y0L9J7_9FIRM|nr:glycine/sarcosine/betaine reductase selenoprotein B family protein [Sulfobacillus harzensis]NMP24444.1 hypothetical protein [Sulfobacillus harzensis]